MSNQVTPEAFFDSLSLAHKLDNYLDGFKLEEIHLFSFFSSFLFHYAGNPIGTWQHKYIVDKKGYPFSDNINEAITRHIQNGLFDMNGEFYTISGRGADEFNKFKVLPNFIKREEFLNAACTTSILVPYSQTLRALLNDPEIKKVEELKNNSWIELMNIYPKFKEISEAVGVHTEDLIIPAVTWINYLNKIENKKV
ncbi:Uncharacterised protein [uncultured archaeon]|nr:Uncharacterised protein [uncultured archaeon]